MLGTAFGSVLHTIAPHSTAPAGAYGLVGMAAVFAAAAHAPITAVIILFELTGDYKIILPLMGAVVISTLVSEALSKETIYTLKLRRQGIDLLAGKDIDLLRSIQIFEAMSTSVPVISGDHSVAEASEILGQSREHALVLVNEAGEIDGMVTIGDVGKALLENKPGQPLSGIATRAVVTAFPDETLSQAIRRMSVRDIQQMPIVRRSNPKRVLGMLRRNDISRAYSQAMLERMETEQQAAGQAERAARHAIGRDPGGARQPLRRHAARRTRFTTRRAGDRHRARRGDGHPARQYCPRCRRPHALLGAA